MGSIIRLICGKNITSHKNQNRKELNSKEKQEILPINSLLVSGGIDIRKNEKDLSNFPDIIVATPGRLVDCIKNSKGIDFSTVDIVVLDEADKLLELGFNEQIKNIMDSFDNDIQTILL